MDDQTVTPAASFREVTKEGFPRTLSTGRKVRQRPVNLLRLIKAGKVPDTLTPYVLSLVWSERKGNQADDKEQAVEWLDYLDFMAGVSLTEPVISDNPQGPNEITLDDLTYQELLDIHAWARTPDFKAVKPFPVEQDGDLESGTESGESEQVAKRVPARAR